MNKSRFILVGIGITLQLVGIVIMLRTLRLSSVAIGLPLVIIGMGLTVMLPAFRLLQDQAKHSKNQPSGTGSVLSIIPKPLLYGLVFSLILVSAVLGYFGYSIGKDMALREKADQLQQSR